MNVWEVTFELLWNNETEFDEDERTFNVAAYDYDSALATAKEEAMSLSYTDKETNKDVDVEDVRLVSIDRGIKIDCVAKSIGKYA